MRRLAKEIGVIGGDQAGQGVQGLPGDVGLHVMDERLVRVEAEALNVAVQAIDDKELFLRRQVDAELIANQIANTLISALGERQGR